jgi:hypothetical protein
MKISPFYDKIKVRAVELLINPAGFNGHSLDEIRSFRKGDRSLLLNSIGVALCVARDEIEGARRAEISFNKGNFRKAEAEIVRAITGA